MLPQSNFWKNKQVFLTGHTGFKGGWLAFWLTQLGAHVHGYALPPPTNPSFFNLLPLQTRLASHTVGDIQNSQLLQDRMQAIQPEIVLHLAAQPLVRLSYEQPLETYATNVMGTAHLLEAVRLCPSVQVVLVITTDKCYENREWMWPYRETEALGGHDPYSSSKACAELITTAYARSFFKDGSCSIATARAGNVIGGGDWAQDRLMTDMIAGLIAGQSPILRNPNATRPWQHVMEPLSGYLRAIEYLWEKRPAEPVAWNFGPVAQDEVPVLQVANLLCDIWGGARPVIDETQTRQPHEAQLLRLDSTKARTELGWFSRLSLRDALQLTVDWAKAWQADKNLSEVTAEQISFYCHGAHTAFKQRQIPASLTHSHINP